ncbi:MAG: super-infection exclusion protein B [Pseudomonadota bacterium]
MDSGWLKALELPAKITGGIFVGSLVTLYLDSVGSLSLAQIGIWLRPLISVAAIFSGALFLANIVNELVMEFRSRQTKKSADAAAIAEKTANDTAASVAKATALAHLDALSEEEIHIVAKALKDGSPSVKWWCHSGGAAQLVHKGLIDQLPGQYMRDNWPFIFHDFAWEAMLNRKEAFLERAAELEASSNKRR